MTMNLGRKAKSVDANDWIKDYLKLIKGGNLTLTLDQIFSDNDAPELEDSNDEPSVPEFVFTCGTEFDPEATDDEFVFTWGKPPQDGDSTYGIDFGTEAASDEPPAPDFIFTCGTTFDPEAANGDFGSEAASDEAPAPEFVFTWGKPSQYGDFIL